MPRALPSVVAVLLALAVVVPAPRASAQILTRFRRQQAPVQKGRYEVDAILSDEFQRLAELKVELALLGDIATFPYDFAARAKGKTLELRGNVPNDMVRQRAMDLARRHTFLRGIDGLTIQPNLSVRSSLRPPNIVQQEGTELLQKELGAPAKQMSLEARPNGVVVLTGRIDCMESKLEISRLFRRLPGCTAVINELTVEPVLVDGQRMVRVTRNNLLLVPPSALGQALEPLPAPTPATMPQKQTPRPVEQQPAISQPAPLRTSSLDARKDELRLPAALALKPSNNSAKPAAEKGGGWEAFAPSKLPVKWGRPAENWEAQAKDLEIANSLPRPSAKPQVSTAASKSSRASARPRLNFAEAREASEEVLTWRRPGGSEESEPKLAPTTSGPRASASGSSPALADAHGPAKSPPAASPVRSSRRWPPAYVTGPPPSQGRTGVIDLDKDLPPAKPAPTVIATSRPLAPADLQRKIKSLCGRQAREVVAAVQKDGVVLVRVKVANRSIEDQLSTKILALPEMSSPRVRLMMEIEP